MQFKLMTSWALVADVYFLPPQKIQEGESAEQFAARIQRMIADVAKLRIVSWDGYLKYYSLAEKVRREYPALCACCVGAMGASIMHRIHSLATCNALQNGLCQRLSALASCCECCGRLHLRTSAYCHAEAAAGGGTQESNSKAAARQLAAGD